MYIDSIVLENFRSFRFAEVHFVHPDQNYRLVDFPAPKLKNVNLLLGNNGFGKTTLLKAIALACLGPAVARAGIFPYRLIRREPAKMGAEPGLAGGKRQLASSADTRAKIDAVFTPHDQDRVGQVFKLESSIEVQREGDLENLEWVHEQEKAWHPIFSSESDALFFVGYGATRRVEQKERFDPGSRRSRVFVRAQRVQSLFEESYSLVPLNSWLPEYKVKNKGRYTQVVNLMNRLVGRGHYAFTGEIEDGEFLFARGGLHIPFPALSDGYRAYLGWVGDLLYHVCMTCPPGKKLVENRGIVMIDEIDLHLHPKWQMTVLPTLAAALPNIQFIVTSHSPLIVGSLEWANIITMKQAARQSSKLERIRFAVNGLDADQVLLTDFFGLESTRSPGKKKSLKALALKARLGDTDAATQMLAQMTRGSEAEQ